ncbi:unnamed protein product [Microthlaspi erraticum]|uniref:Uncharacterized protein n=1 Tax=Microthlaspi erraticum TaxID=1685480 RepID=A0A6D2KTG8_9BRAS|nr:unnamed protein product [Microthlaspi erraticum]
MAGEASEDASVGLRAGTAPGGGGAPAQGRDDLVVGLLTQLVARFLAEVPQWGTGSTSSGRGASSTWCCRGRSAEGCGFWCVALSEDYGAHAEDWYVVF